MDPERLRAFPLFRHVPHSLAVKVAASAGCTQIPRGTTVYNKHEFHRCLGLVCNGLIRVSMDQLLISTLQAGGIFGAAALFHRRPEYPTTLTALTDCTVCYIPEEQLQHLLRDCPQFAEDYVIYLSDRIHFLTSRLDALAAGTAEDKLKQYLLTCADHSDSVTQSATQLSAQIGVGRASLYRAFDSLEQSGAILREGKTIHILSKEKLYH